jgi:hypothetical protein
MRPISRFARFAALLLAAAAPTLVFADELDTRLLADVAPKVLDALRERGYKNVGVLKFEVQRGGEKGPVLMSAGSLNSMMATRLENALILASDKDPIGIVRGPSQIAASRDSKAGFHTEAARRALLAQKYPLAWGNTEVAVDGFVIGRVTFSSDYKTVTVALRAFGNDDLKSKEIARIETPIERSLLVDAGQPFAAPMVEVRKRLLLVGAGENQPLPPPVEDVVLEEVRQSAKSTDEESGLKTFDKGIAVQSPAAPAARVKKDLDRVLKVEVAYDGKPVAWIGDNRLPTPAPDTSVEIRLRATERLGVVLRVNGVNTADDDHEERPVRDYSTWVLEPDVDYTVRGFYTPKNELIKFTAAKLKAVERSELGDERRIGKIDIDVFQVAPKGAAAQNAGDPPPAVDLRERAMADTLPELRGKLRTLSARKVVAQPRQLIVGGAVQQVNLRMVNFTGIHTIHLPVTYFDARAVTPPFLQPDLE